MSETWLSPEAYARLQDELAELSGPVRADVVKKIAAARDEGDLKENAGYHAARDEQGKLEARIRQLTALLENAVVGEAPTVEGVVTVGSIVTVVYAGEDEAESFLLGSREDKGSGDHEVYSPQSPLGAALLGRRVGESVTYPLPNGKKAEVTVEGVAPAR